MAEGLNVVIVDDEPIVCDVISQIVKRFYTWGDVVAFTDPGKAKAYCLSNDLGAAIFVLDVFLKGESGFSFLDAIEDKYPTAASDTIMISGKASDEVVDMCVASDVYYLLEKPIKPYALQLAIRAIVSKYLKFAKRILQDADFAQAVARF
jgi:DNA-binding NtrC family response regulator